MKVDFNFYCYCFERKWLYRHLQEARQGIRFITPDYKEKFRIPDGDKIRIFQPDGGSKDFTCRYIDDCHLEVGSGLYHICQFAEIMEHTGDIARMCLSEIARTALALQKQNRTFDKSPRKQYPTRT